jgi:hypothetical protein
MRRACSGGGRARADVLLGILRLEYPQPHTRRAYDYTTGTAKGKSACRAFHWPCVNALDEGIIRVTGKDDLCQ